MKPFIRNFAFLFLIAVSSNVLVPQVCFGDDYQGSEPEEDKAREAEEKKKADAKKKADSEAKTKADAEAKAKADALTKVAEYAQKRNPTPQDRERLRQSLLDQGFPESTVDQIFQDLDDARRDRRIAELERLARDLERQQRNQQNQPQQKQEEQQQQQKEAAAAAPAAGAGMGGGEGGKGKGGDDKMAQAGKEARDAIAKAGEQKGNGNDFLSMFLKQGQSPDAKLDPKMAEFLSGKGFGDGPTAAADALVRSIGEWGAVRSGYQGAFLPKTGGDRVVQGGPNGKGSMEFDSGSGRTYGVTRLLSSIDSASVRKPSVRSFYSGATRGVQENRDLDLFRVVFPGTGTSNETTFIPGGHSSR